MAASRYRGFALYRRLLLQARPYWPAIACILVLDLLGTPLSLLKPVSLKIAVDNVLGSKPVPGFLHALLPDALTRSALALLFVAAALQVLVVLLVQLQSMTHYWLYTQAGERLTLDFRARLFRHLQRLSLSFHDTRGTADSIYRVEYDAPSIQWLTIHGMLPFVSEGVMLASMIYVMARIDWQLALVALAISPFLFFQARNYEVRMGPRYERVKELESRAMGVVQEVLTAVRVVKAFGREEREQERFVRYSGEGVRAHIRLALAEGVFGLTVNSVIAIGAALVLFIGVRGVQSGRLTLGDLLLVMAYLTELYAPLEKISGQIATMQASLASARRAFELLDELPEVGERPNARPLKRASGAVEFRDISFAYDGRNRVLQDVSFTAPAGTRVGIAGRTGAGKTTLFSLLVRFYDPTRGQILLDGVDLRDYRLSDLRNQFGLVLQEPVLFSTTIAENIAYGRPGAPEQEIVEAATAAGAHHFITQLPEGYQTNVGERGMLLSGGERQRISLARAFLKDAPILILDEPTSSVDLRTEADIMEAMERLMVGRTTFFISHRPNTLRNCDVVLRLEDGHLDDGIAEVGARATRALASRAESLGGSLEGYRRTQSP
jgi:ATP-binding cassette subfamily B protein